MSDTTTTAPRQPNASKGLVFTLVVFPFQLFGILCAALFLSVIVEWVGMKFFWPDTGWHHAERMLEAELEQLSGQFKQGVLLASPSSSARELVVKAHEFVFVKSGFVAWTQEAQTRVSNPARARTFRDYLAMAHVYLKDALVAAAYTSLVFFTRLLVLVLTLPLFLLAAFVGFVDGLVRRDIRRFSAD